MRGSSRCARRSKARSGRVSARSPSAPSSSPARRCCASSTGAPSAVVLDDLRRLDRPARGRAGRADRPRATTWSGCTPSLRRRRRPSRKAGCGQLEARVRRAQERDRRGRRQPRGGRAGARPREPLAASEHHDQRGVREGAGAMRRSRPRRRRRLEPPPGRRARSSSPRCAKGVFIGDSYNDQPALLAARRRDRPAPERGDGRICASARRASPACATSLPRRRGATRSVAAAELTAPVRGSVWEVLTAPGETVVRGQDLVRLLDCSGRRRHRDASASRSTTGCSIGDSARVPRCAARAPMHKGRIVGLTGVASAPANLAIQPERAGQGALPRDGAAAAGDPAERAVRRRPHRPRHLRPMSPDGQHPARGAGAGFLVLGAALVALPWLDPRDERARAVDGGRAGRPDVALHVLALALDAAAAGSDARLRSSASSSS